MDLILRSQLAEFKVDRGLSTWQDDALFEVFAAFCLVGRIHEDHFDPTTLRSGGVGDQGIDAYGILINGELFSDPADVRDALALGKNPLIQFVVVQAKLTDGFESKVFTELSDTLLNIFTAPRLREGCNDRIKNLRACVDQIYDAPGRVAWNMPRLQVWYVATGKAPSRRLEPKRLEAEEALRRSKAFGRAEVRAAGVSEVTAMYRSAMEVRSTTLTVPRAMRASMPVMPGVQRGVVGLVKARDFVRDVLRDKSGLLRQSLFEENVRDFLGYAATNPVNPRIRSTLRDPIEKQRFAVLNNGITIVAKELEEVKDSLVMRDFRIVNGCQTSNALFDEFENLDDDVYVGIRIFESSDDEITEGIVIASNQQAAIDPHDLVVRGKFHRVLEQYFAAHPPGVRLYYERRVGQYRRLDFEQTRVITRAELIRAHASVFLGEPWRVWRLTDLIQTRAADLFPPGFTDPLPYYVSASIHYRIGFLLRNRPALADYRTARYALMTAVKLRLLGDNGLPKAAQDRKTQCDAVVDLMWDAPVAEGVVIELLPALRATINAETIAGSSLADVVRTQRFADRLKDLVLGGS